MFEGKLYESSDVENNHLFVEKVCQFIVPSVLRRPHISTSQTAKQTCLLNVSNLFRPFSVLRDVFHICVCEIETYPCYFSPPTLQLYVALCFGCIKLM